MPTYDYRCTVCGARFEAWQKFSDEPIRVCPTCSGPAQRVIHAPAITFKGSGFYSTDSRAAATKEKEAASPAPAEGAPAEAAPAASESAAKTGDAAAPAKPAASGESAPSAAPAPASPAKPAAAPSTN